MFSRKSEGEKRYDALAAAAEATMDYLMRKDLKNLTEEDKAALAGAGLFGSGMKARCFIKSVELGEQRAQSTKLKDRFLRAVNPGYLMPYMHSRAIERAVKEEMVRDHEAYQAKLEFLRQHGATAERITQEAQRLSDELKTAGTLAQDLKVGKPLSLKKPRR
jgi:hypothetical protein